MSIFSKIKKAVTGGVKGLVTGGPGGMIGGAIMGLATPKNPAKTTNKGPKPALVNATVQAPSYVSNPTGGTLGTVNQYSANPLVRYASSTVLAPLPGPLASPGQIFNSVVGNSGLWPTTTQGAAPMWAYRRLYTKKGTPRRTRRDGMPYAVPRMNPMNPRAARRAITRIRGARKLLQRIERSLPKARTRAPARRRAA